MKSPLFSLIVLFFLSVALSGQNELFDEGNKAYKEKDYTLAIENYTKLVAAGKVSPELYYNLANAYFKSDQLGKSILYYEKAHQAKPSDKNIEQNLLLARDEIDSPVIEVPEFFIVRYWKSIGGLFSPFVWNILQFLMTVLLLYGIYLWKLGNSEDLRLKGFGFLLLGLFLVVFTFFAGRTAHHELTRQDGAILMEPTALRSGPDDRSAEQELLSEGIKVKIVDTIDDWHKVILLNKDYGWIPKSKLEII